MISDLKPGDNLTAYLVLRKKAVKTQRHSSELYLSVELGDATGRISGSMWKDPAELYASLEVGDIVKTMGRVINFKERLHLNIDKIRKATSTDRYDPTPLIPRTEKDLDGLFGELDEVVHSVAQPSLSKLLLSIFGDKKLRSDFGRAPGGKLWHHNYLGGLLEHTLTVANICDRACDLYPGLNHDLLIAAALLHDIGKIAAYSHGPLIDFTDEGRLMGHIVLGANLVRDKIRAIEGFSKELETELLHLILSHQGKLEHASPIVPMTLEGLILYHADALDSNASAFERIQKKEQEPGKNWSSYVRLLDRHLYIPERPQ